MMQTDSVKHVKKTNHENNVLLGSHEQIAGLTRSRMYHIPEYVPNVPGTLAVGCTFKPGLHICHQSIEKILPNESCKPMTFSIAQ
jgi:hypothetical protein